MAKYKVAYENLKNQKRKPQPEIVDRIRCSLPWRICCKPKNQTLAYAIRLSAFIIIDYYFIRISPRIEKLAKILKTYDHVLSGRYVSRLLQNKKPTIHNMNLAFTSNCDDGWRNLRNLYKTELFSGKALDSSVNIRENKVIEMVKYLASKEGECKVIKDVVFVTSMNILGNASLSIDLVDFEGNGVGARIMSSVRKLTMLGAKPILADMYSIFSRWDLQGWYKEFMHIVE
ncbi:cytochrome P450 [Artemisia annua]|uniref:Cytochrome P450 n=1 Tax=Artemisia annua TaxID=35608 RepID=A0A2U1M2I1_ARTAN|nr:cytochrome P450 [Artemisia annua]